MELLYSILSTLHIFVCVILIILILLQKTTGSGLFTSSSSSNPFMSGVEVTTALSVMTKYLGIFFLLNTLFLGALSVKISNQNKVITLKEDTKEVVNTNDQIPLDS